MLLEIDSELKVGAELVRAVYFNNQTVMVNPRSIFTNNEQGVWYDPSDMSTMFQDSAGTTPVTAVGQPVGRILDKSGRGNHATQTTATSRPVLSARYNLLTNTEAFESASWSRFQTVISNNYVIGPFGRPADLLVVDTNSGEHVTWQNITFVSGLRYRFSVYLKNHTTTYGRYQVNDNSAFGFNASVTINLNNNTITGDSGALNRTLTSLGDGWFKAEFEAVATSTTTTVFNIRLLNSTGAALYSGDGASGVYLGAVDLRVANDALNQPAYQRVNTETDYDTAGFKPYLRFDGVDDFLVTPSIDFTGADKMTVFAGSRYFGDAGGVICELSANANNNSGAFVVAVNDDVAGRESVSARGSSPGAAGTFFTAPKDITRVTTRQIDFAQSTSGTEFAMRIDGVTQTPARATAGSAGSGNFGNYPLYIGRRGGTTAPFNGRLYSLIIRGAQSTAQQIADIEKWMNKKTGAYQR